VAVVAYHLAGRQPAEPARRIIPIQLPGETETLLQVTDARRVAAVPAGAAAMAVAPPATTMPEPEMTAVTVPPAPEPAVTAAPVTRAGTAANDRAQPLSRAFTGLKDAAWLRTQNPGNYVLQLIGAREIRTLEKYLENAPGVRAKLAIISTTNAGQPWHIFVYGIYTDRDAAMADVNQLPAAIRRPQPWPRTVASVLQDLDRTP
jgi:DamX protein